MLRGQIKKYLPPGHPIIVIQNNRNQNGGRICKKVYNLIACDVTVAMLVERPKAKKSFGNLIL